MIRRSAAGPAGKCRKAGRTGRARASMGHPMDTPVTVEEPTVAGVPASDKDEPLPLQAGKYSSATSVAAVVAGVAAESPWPAPEEVRTSGSVVRNSMTLLPADVSIAQSQGSGIRTIVSGVAVDAAGEPCAKQHTVGTATKVGSAETEEARQKELIGDADSAGATRGADAERAASSPAGDSTPTVNSTSRQPTQVCDTGTSAPRSAEEREKLTADTGLMGDNASGKVGSLTGEEDRQCDRLAAKNSFTGGSAEDGDTAVVSSAQCNNGCLPKISSADAPVRAKVDPSGADEIEAGGSIAAPEVGKSATAGQAASDASAENNSGAFIQRPRNEDVLAVVCGTTDKALIEMPLVTEQSESPHLEADVAVNGDNIHKDQAEVFIPCDSFTGGKPAYVFKLGDKGLGFYVDGYIDQPTKTKRVLSHRPWNAGPGDEAIRRGPIGPVYKLFKKSITLRRDREKATAESDTRPFMARMVAQRNSRSFQTTLLDRENILDEHILSLLEKFSDPTFFKKKYGYNIHGQMLGKDGKMIIKVKMEKTEEEKAKLQWYRKVYEDRLGKHLPSKRLGDSIEARREAYAYSRHFTAELNGREAELDHSLVKALKGQTKLEFITEDYHYPGAYDTDGKVILEKGTPISNELHPSDEQKERACSYRFKAIQRFRAAHEDLASAVSKNDKALQKMIKKTDASILQEIAEDAVKSSGIGIYRQKKRTSRENESGNGSLSAEVVTESPEQLRDKFAESLKGQIKEKDKALMKEVAALDGKDAEQMIEDSGKGVEVLPGSWRQDPANLKRMQKRRKELIAEIAADRRKVVCPWRPGGAHIAHEPWKPFTPRNHRPPVRSASEGKAGGDAASARDAMAQENGGCDVKMDGSESRTDRGGRRPHTAPTHRKNEFMGSISARARRILAAQPPGTPLHCAYSTYSNDPFPLERLQRRNHRPAGTRTDYLAEDDSHPRSHPLPSKPYFQPRENAGDERQQHAWMELPRSSKRPQYIARANISSKSLTRPHSAAADYPRRVCVPSRRPSTASGTRNPTSGAGGGAAVPAGEIQEREHENDGFSKNFDVQSGPGVTVLWARLCGPSSDIAYKSSTWPSRPSIPRASRSTRRRTRPFKQPTGDKAGSDQRPSAAHIGADEDPAILTAASYHAADDEGRRAEKVEHSEGGADPATPLEDLEKGLVTSSLRRVSQRKHVFRGYSERSRRAQTWDPGSSFFAEGASRHQRARDRSSTRESNGQGSECGTSATRLQGTGNSVGQCRWGKQRKRSRAAVEDMDSPVDMDWQEVDTKCFGDAADEMKAALEGKLFVVVTNDDGDGKLNDCFREAQELVDSSGALLGCPENIRERFTQENSGELRIGNYVATVSRLHILWMVTCGVVEIVGMLRRREELLEVSWATYLAGMASQLQGSAQPTHFEKDFCSGNNYYVQKVKGSSTLEYIDGQGEGYPAPSAAVRPPPHENRIHQYEKRLELTEFAIAIAESLKSWLSTVPWRVRVLYDGEHILSKLGAEEQGLPWPPYPDAELCSHPGDLLEGEGRSDNHFPVFGPKPRAMCDDPPVETGSGGGGLTINTSAEGDAPFREGSEKESKAEDKVNITIDGVASVATGDGEDLLLNTTSTSNNVP